MKKFSLIIIIGLSIQFMNVAVACEDSEAGVDFLAQNEYRVFSKINDVNQVSPDAANYLFKRINDVRICKEESLEGLSVLHETTHGSEVASIYKEGQTTTSKTVDLLVSAVLSKSEMYLNTSVIDENQIFKVIAKELIPGEDVTQDRRARALGNLLNRAGKMNPSDFAKALQNLKISFKPEEEIPSSSLGG